MTTHRRQLLSLMAGLPLIGSIFGGPAMAQTAPTPGPTPAPAPVPPAPVAGPRVKITTPRGVIVIEVYPDKAPITAGNFLRYVDEKRFAGASFYRGLQYAEIPGDGLVQAGLSGLPVGRRLPGIKHEPTTKTGLKHKDGAVSIARLAPGTAASEFFIVVGDTSGGLDADPKQPGDNLGFAVFGQVIEGMDLVRAMLASPKSRTKGAEFGMKGQMLEPTIPITRIARVT